MPGSRRRPRAPGRVTPRPSSPREDRLPRRTGGGAATASGTTFQEDVAAWLAVQVLAERAAAAGLGLPADVTLEMLTAESYTPVDDLGIVTSADGQLFFQCKSTITLSTGSESDFAKVVRQFVRQIRAGHQTTEQRIRPLVPDLDRLVLAVGERSPASITVELRKALESAGSVTSSAELGVGLKGLNADQRKALSALNAHFVREWRSASGVAPTPDDWLAFLHLMRVRRFDLTIDGGDRREADRLLRNQVLQAPERAAAAWSELIGAVRAFAPDRRSGDRRFFRQRLTTSGYGLQGIRSYRDATEAVRRHSQIELDYVGPNACITYQGREVRIAREVTRAILEMAVDGDLLVIGEPGAGKSGCLLDLIRSARDAGADCVFLRVESLDTTTVATISRDIQIPHGMTLIDVLAAWPIGRDAAGNEQQRHLVIDALDTARDGRGISTICDLVQRLRIEAPGWRVLASIREFDLKHHDRVKALFVGQPHARFRSPSFESVRHVRVPPLTDEELAYAEQQVPELSSPFAAGGSALRDLVRNPFNLKLLVELLPYDVPTCELATTRTQVQLLDRYWDARLAPDTGGRSTLAVRSLVADMFRQRRLLTKLSLLSTALPDYAAEFEHLHRAGILRSSPSSPLAGSDPLVSFSHNILLDYAAARVWLGDIGADIIEELQRQENQDLLLFARPALHLAFQRIWNVDAAASPSRAMFWDRARAFEGSMVRPIGKIIPSAVAASGLNDLADISSLLDQLESPSTRTAAEALLQHVLVGLLARTRDPDLNWRITGPGAPPWLAVAADIARRNLSRCAWQLRLLLLEVEREEKHALTPEQTAQANRAARALVLWSTAEPGATAALMTGISVACKTVQAEPRLTIAALEPILGKAYIEEWYDLLLPIAKNFTQVAIASPRFACRAIRAAYARDYTQEDLINRGSRILPLRFNKRDWLEHVRRAIGESLGELATLAPPLAAFLIFQFLRLAVTNRRSSRPSDNGGATFQFRGRRSVLVPDYSVVFVESSHVQHGPWYPALKSLESMLAQLAGDPTAAADLNRILDIFARRARPALLWTTLMRAGATAPATLGVQLLELVNTPALLTAMDTEVAAGDLLHNLWPHLPTRIRADVERTILSLPLAGDADEREALQRDRDRLLGCIPDGTIETAEARDTLAEVRAGGGPPENQPTSRIEARSVSDEDYLRMIGVDLSSPANVDMLGLITLLKNTTETGTQQPLSLAAFEHAIPHFIALQARLSDADAREIHRDVIGRAGSAFYSALAALARTEGLTAEHMHYAFLRHALLASSAHPRPQAPEAIEPSSRRGFACWSGGEPRIEAAQGLVALARNSRSPDTEIFEAVLRLSRDPHWAVRYQVRAHANALWESNRPLMWQIIEETASEETDLCILRFFTRMLVNALLWGDPDRIDGIVTAVQVRVNDTEDHESIASTVAHLLIKRMVSENHEASARRLDAWLVDLVTNEPYLQAVFQHCRDLMTMEAPNGDHIAASRVKEWAFRFQRSAIDRILEHYRELTQRNPQIPVANWPQADIRALEVIFHLADTIAGEVLIASGASGSDRQDRWAQVDNRDCIFFREGFALIERLCDCPFAHPAYELIETLRFFVPCDPATVFGLIARCLRAAREDSIQFEQLAADLVVSIVEHYLSAYCALIQTDPILRHALLDVLDLFTVAGWPNAVRLVFRLEEVYR